VRELERERERERERESARESARERAREGDLLGEEERVGNTIGNASMFHHYDLMSVYNSA